jgi:chromate transporter
VGIFGWVTPAQFGVAVGLSYATPGPVLIIAAYIEYRAEGLAGAVAATVAVFAVPVLAAVAAASAVQRLSVSASPTMLSSCSSESQSNASHRWPLRR